MLGGKIIERQQCIAIKWSKELSTTRTGDLNAPSWLWSSVVDLLVIHEKAIS
jgi:hypothetical protein